MDDGSLMGTYKQWHVWGTPFSVDLPINERTPNWVAYRLDIHLFVFGHSFLKIVEM